MNKTVFNILGGLTILTTICFLSQIRERFAALPPAEHPKLITGVIIIAGLLSIIAAVCLIPQSRPFTLRMLGIVGIAGCIFNLIQGFYQRNFSQYPATLVVWLPGSIYLAIKGKMSSESRN